MKKTLIATAVTSLLLSGALSATQIYTDKGTTVSIGGNIALGVTGGDVVKKPSGKDASTFVYQTRVDEDSPRINVEATHELGNGFKADAKGEWEMNTTQGGAPSFTTRLGYIGIDQATFGRAVIGTQSSPYYDVQGVADMPIWFDSDAADQNQGNLGTQRADRMVSYRNGFEFGRDVKLNFGLGWQGKHAEAVADPGGTSKNLDYSNEYYSRAQGEISASAFGVTLGFAGSQGDVYYAGKDEMPAVKNKDKSNDAVSKTVSLKYGQYGKGLYVAGAYAMNEYMNRLLDANGMEASYSSYANILKKSTTTEAIIAYALPNSLNFSINYEVLNGVAPDATMTAGVENKKKNIRSEAAFQVEYHVMPSVALFTGYQADLGGYSRVAQNTPSEWNKKERNKNNQYVIGTQVSF